MSTVVRNLRAKYEQCFPRWNCKKIGTAYVIIVSKKEEMHEYCGFSG